MARQDKGVWGRAENNICSPINTRAFCITTEVVGYLIFVEREDNGQMQDRLQANHQEGWLTISDASALGNADALSFGNSYSRSIRSEL